MRPTPTDVAHSMVYVSMHVLATRVSCAKMGKPIEMPFGGLTNMSPSNHVFVQDQTNPFAATGVTSCRCSVLPNYFGHLLNYQVLA